MADFDAIFNHGTSANAVSVGRQSTEGYNNSRSLNAAIKPVALGDGKRCWGCNQVGHTKRECPKKPTEIKRRSL